MATDNQYPTSDTALAAYLIVSGFQFQSIDYSKPRFEFLFEDSEKLRTAANKYITGNALTDPSGYARVFKKLNRIIFKRCQWEED